MLKCEQVLAGTDIKNRAHAATAATELTTIKKQLAAIKGDGHTERARTGVREQVLKLKLASIEAL